MSAVPPPEGVFDQGVPWHFGNPLSEQRYLADGHAAVDMRNHGVLSVAGPDRLTWLHDLTTQYLRDLAPGDSALALILSPNGHVEHELHIVDDGSTSWLITQPGATEALLTYLESMKFMLRVDIADRGSDYVVVGESAHRAEGLGWRVPNPFAQRGYSLRESIVPIEDFDARMRAYDRQAGSWAREALRVAATMPRIGLDADHRTIPNESDWLMSAVHLNKGCYRGQETVAKVNNLGQPPRRLSLVHLDGSTDELPHHGAVILHNGKQVGWIGTSAQHHELGPIATAMLKRSVPAQADLQVEMSDGQINVREEAT